MPNIPNLHFSKHNTIKITLDDGSTILARITRYNEQTGKVCWIDRDEKWKGSMHASKVVVASPKEVAEWSANKASKVAPLDPCMAGYELGKTKKGPMMMEGYYFSVAVYKDHKKIGEIVDEGNGGTVDTRNFKNPADERLFNEACRKWCENNGADLQYVEEASEFWTWWDTARLNGTDAKTYFKEKNETFAKMFGEQKPTHTGNLDLVNGKI